tara:strand:- start:600 stop:863 length:264 start_codon:yes stop_codon:yes gene_type:complete
MEKLWFKRRRLGWGWRPASWEGWLVTLGFFGVLLYLGVSIDEAATDKDALLNLVLPVFVLTILLIRIAYLTGESPRWQWGKRRKDSE